MPLLATCQCLPIYVEHLCLPDVTLIFPTANKKRGTPGASADRSNFANEFDDRVDGDLDPDNTRGPWLPRLFIPSKSLTSCKIVRGTARAMHWKNREPEMKRPSSLNERGTVKAPNSRILKFTVPYGIVPARRFQGTVRKGNSGIPYPAMKLQREILSRGKWREEVKDERRAKPRGE